MHNGSPLNLAHANAIYFLLQHSRAVTNVSDHQIIYKPVCKIKKDMIKKAKFRGSNPKFYHLE